MTLTSLLLVNAVPATIVAYALLYLLARAVHADVQHRAARAAEVRALPLDRRDRVAA